MNQEPNKHKTKTTYVTKHAHLTCRFASIHKCCFNNFDKVCKLGRPTCKSDKFGKIVTAAGQLTTRIKNQQKQKHIVLALRPMPPPYFKPSEVHAMIAIQLINQTPCVYIDKSSEGEVQESTT